MKAFLLFSSNFNRKRGITPALLVAALVLLIVLNLIAGTVETKYGLKADVSGGGLFALSEQTEQILSELDRDITIYTLYSPGNDNKAVVELLNKYKARSSRITVSNVDPSSNAAWLSRFDPNGQGIAVGSVIVTDQADGHFRVTPPGELYEVDTRTGKVYFNAESKVTASINYVMTGELRRVRLLFGHGERANSEMTSLLAMLYELNYDVSLYDYLRSTDPLVPDTDVLIVISPKTDLSEAEYAALNTFLENGGNTVFLLDRVEYDKSTGSIQPVAVELSYFERLLASYGMYIEDNLLVGSDAQYTGLRATTLALSSAMDDEDALPGQAVFSECASISIYAKEDVLVRPLLKTSDTCFARQLGDRAHNLQCQKTDVLQSFVVGAVSEKIGSKLGLFSTSSFITDNEINMAGNAELILGVISDMGGEPGVSLPAKVFYAAPSSIDSVFQRTLIIAIALVILPMATVLFGMSVCLKRRRMK